MSDIPRLDTIEIRLTEQERTIEDLNRTITEQWRVIYESAVERHDQAAAGRSTARLVTSTVSPGQA